MAVHFLPQVLYSIIGQTQESDLKDKPSTVQSPASRPITEGYQSEVDEFTTHDEFKSLGRSGGEKSITEAYSITEEPPVEIRQQLGNGGQNIVTLYQGQLLKSKTLDPNGLELETTSLEYDGIVVRNQEYGQYYLTRKFIDDRNFFLNGKRISTEEIRDTSGKLLQEKRYGLDKNNSPFVKEIISYGDRNKLIERLDEQGKVRLQIWE